MFWLARASLVIPRSNALVAPLMSSLSILDWLASNRCGYGSSMARPKAVVIYWPKAVSPGPRQSAPQFRGIEVIASLLHTSRVNQTVVHTVGEEVRDGRCPMTEGVHAVFDTAMMEVLGMRPKKSAPSLLVAIVIYWPKAVSPGPRR